MQCFVRRTIIQESLFMNRYFTENFISFSLKKFICKSFPLFHYGPLRSSAGCLPLNILKGHCGKVTCLLYPNEENPRYDITHLVSGGSDFTVRLWDVFSGSLLHTFNSHGGEVIKLMVTPPDCKVRTLMYLQERL